MQKTLIATLFIAAFGTVQAAETAEQPPLPNVLIIGDSISIGYMDPLKKLLDGKANVVHNEGNAAHSKNGLEKLDGWLGDTKWDVIHFNHGLHDLKYVDENGKNTSSRDAGHKQIPLDEYKKNMDAIVSRMEKTGAKLVFATTTPIQENTTNPLREPDDAAKYNAAALEVMKRHGVAIDDLYSFALPRLTEIQRPQNVHFTADGYALLAREVARHITEALGLPATRTEAQAP